MKVTDWVSHFSWWTLTFFFENQSDEIIRTCVFIPHCKFHLHCFSWSPMFLKITLDSLWKSVRQFNVSFISFNHFWETAFLLSGSGHNSTWYQRRHHIKGRQRHFFRWMYSHLNIQSSGFTEQDTVSRLNNSCLQRSVELLNWAANLTMTHALLLWEDEAAAASVSSDHCSSISSAFIYHSRWSEQETGSDEPCCI